MKRRCRVPSDEVFFPREAHAVCEELKRAQRAFEEADDPRLVSAAVYRLRSLELRYAYLLQTIGEMNRS